MKNIRILALVLVALMLLTATAFADGMSINSVSGSSSKVSWSVSGWHTTYDVYVDGSRIVQRSKDSGSYNMTLSAGSHSFKVVDLDGCSASTSFTVAGGEPAPVEPTVAPTEAPDEPDVTTKPDKTKKPSSTKKASTGDDDNDVPKTGDATASTLVIVLMMAAAAAILVIRRAARNR